MAIFKVPKITTAQRLLLVLDDAEVVFDTNTKVYFGGDGSTYGGFPIGQGAATQTEIFTLTATDIANKYVALATNPSSVNIVSVLPEGGIPQIPSVDFTIISGNLLSWNGLGLDNFLEEGETIVVSY